MSPFQVYGPFQFDRKKIHDREYRNAWWDDRDGDEPGLRRAKGVYLLSLKNKHNYVPQYVGITKAQGCYKEVFRESNLLKVAHDLSKERGSFQIHLIAKPRASHSGFSKQIKHDTLKWLERLILFSCLTKNPEQVAPGIPKVRRNWSSDRRSCPRTAARPNSQLYECSRLHLTDEG